MLIQERVEDRLRKQQPSPTRLLGKIVFVSRATSGWRLEDIWATYGILGVVLHVDGTQHRPSGHLMRRNDGRCGAIKGAGSTNPADIGGHLTARGDHQCRHDSLAHRNNIL